MQLATLLGLHKSGLPPGFIYAYAILIVANAWTRAGFIVWAKHSAIAEVVLDSMYVYYNDFASQIATDK